MIKYYDSYQKGTQSSRGEWNSPPIGFYLKLLNPTRGLKIKEVRDFRF